MSNFNFFNFGGGPGGPGGPGSRGRGASKDVDTEHLYKLLGIDKNANQNDIKKSFRKMAMTHHPDKGGDPEKFKEITKAYEILSDPEKKTLYDQHGLEGVESGGQSAPDIFDLFGGGGSRRGRNEKRRGEDVVFPLKVTLEELFNGMSKKLRLTKSVICKDCEGKGGKGATDITCKDCRGQGIKVVIRQLGPGMIQQMQTTCDKCNGEGTVIADKDKCKTCKGAKVNKEKKTLEVFVSKGMSHNTKIPFKGEADEAPNTVPGDVIVVLQAKEHAVFKRDGANLFMKKHITLQEALCGFQFTITHLDGRLLLVRSDENTVYTPGSFKAIKEEGMPQLKNSFFRGSLYVEFDVEFPKPEQLPKNTKQALIKLLPPPPPPSEPMETEQGKEVEEVTLVDVDIEAEKRKFEQQHKEAYEEDEDQRRSTGGAQGCRAQ